MTLLLQARDLAVQIKQQTIIRDIDLEVARGRIITLIGPNGAGKTTLLRALLGLQPISQGEIWRAPRLRLGYMPQLTALSPTLPLRVDDFLQLAGRYGQAERRQALAETGVERLQGHSVHGLSGGEWQRVLLARALLRRPDLLVLDEPVQGVDVNGQAAIYQLIQDISQQHGCGVLMVSHDLHLVMAATDQVLCINGHICCSGHPEAVSRHPAYRQLFTPYEASKIAFYTHHHDHQHDLPHDPSQGACTDHEHP